MRLYKQIDIDIDGCRKRIMLNFTNPDTGKTASLYTKKEQKDLLHLCDLFEGGKFTEAFKLIRTWSAEQIEHIDCEIYDALYDMALCGNSYLTEKDIRKERGG